MNHLWGEGKAVEEKQVKRKVRKESEEGWVGEGEDEEGECCKWF